MDGNTISYVVGALVFLLVVFIYNGLPMVLEWLQQRRQQTLDHEAKMTQIRADQPPPPAPGEPSAWGG